MSRRLVAEAILLVVALIGIVFIGAYFINHAYSGPQCWLNGQRISGNLTVFYHFNGGWSGNQTTVCRP